MTNLLYQWAGVEDVDPSSRGSYVDAQHLEFLEHLFGTDFYQSAQRTADPYPEAADIDQAWNGVYHNFEAQLLLQAGGSSLFTDPVIYDPWTGTVSGDVHLSESAVDALATNAPSGSSDNVAYWTLVGHFIDSIEGISNVTTTEAGWLDDTIYSTNVNLSWDDIVNIVGGVVATNTINGTSGDDTLTGGSLADTIHGYDGNDVIHGGAENDVVYGGNGNDTIYGDAGSDELRGESGDDVIYGGDGNDTIMGGDGADTLHGDGGGNLVYGGDGNDTYVYTAGADDVYSESSNGGGGSADQIVLPSGITSSDVTFYRVPTDTTTYFDDLLIVFAGGGSIQIQNHFHAGVNSIETLVFSDSSTIDLTSLGALPTLLSNGDDSYSNTGSGNQVVSGLDGADAIYTGSGNDTLDGGNGNDALHGGTGNDTYLAGPGYDTIYESGGTDTIVVPTGYDASDITFERRVVSGDDGLVISIAGLGEILVSNQFTGSSYQVENLHFTDGNTTVSLTDQVIQTVGTPGDEFLYGLTTGVGGNWFDGRGGGDVIYNGIGNNTYVFEAGFGTSTINQSYHSATNVIDFEGVDPSHVRMWITASGPAFYLHLQDTTDTSHSITAQIGATGSYTPDVAGYLQHVNFDDVSNTSWDLTGGLTLTGNNTGSTLLGTDYGDTITGGTGADTIYAYGGNDTIVGGAGDDYLVGGTGNDTYVIGPSFGSVSIVESLSEGSDTLHLAGLAPTDVRLYTDTYGTLHIVDVSNSSENITISAGTTGNNYYESTVDQYLEHITFDSTYGTTWDLANGLNLTGTSGTDTLYGTAHDDTINGLGGVGILYGNAGNDTIYGGSTYDYIEGGPGNDVIQGNGGSDDLYGNAGADTFMFKAASAFSSSANIDDFSTSDGDKIDISDVISGYDPLTDTITDWVQITTSGSNSILKVDTDGTGSGHTWQQIATIVGVTGLTDEAALVSSGNLIVHA